MTEPDEAMKVWQAARKAWNSAGLLYDTDPTADQAAAAILRDHVEAVKAEVRAEQGELLTIAWMDGSHRSAKGVRKALADRDRTIAEQAAEIERLRTLAEAGYRIARTALNKDQADAGEQGQP